MRIAIIGHDLKVARIVDWDRRVHPQSLNTPESRLVPGPDPRINRLVEISDRPDLEVGASFPFGPHPGV